MAGDCSKKNKTYKIGIISGLEAFDEIAIGFKTKLRKLGYVENKNVLYEFYNINSNNEKESEILMKFLKEKVDLVFTFPTKATLIAKQNMRLTNIPLLFALSGIEGNNIIKNMQEPGGNITGVRFGGPDNAIKRLKILKEIVPGIRRVMIFYDPDYPTNKPVIKVLRPATTSFGIKLVEYPVNNIENLKEVLLKKVKTDKLDAILIMAEILTQTSEGFKAILQFAETKKIPVGGDLIFNANQGALFSYNSDMFEMGEQAAVIAVKIFNGIPAGTIPVVSAENHLQINYKVAHNLGIKVPEGLLKQAHKIFK